MSLFRKQPGRNGVGEGRLSGLITGNIDKEVSCMNNYHAMKSVPNVESIDNMDQRLWQRLERVEMLGGRCLRMEDSHRFGRGRDGSRGQGRVLQVLSQVSEIGQKELTEQLGMRQQSLGELLGKLEAKGLVAREQDAQDHRRQVVRLTDAGRAAVAEMAPASEGQEHPSFFDCLSDEEKEQLDGYLARVGETLEHRVNAAMERRVMREGRHGGRGRRGGEGHHHKGRHGERRGGGWQHRPQESSTQEPVLSGEGEAAVVCDHNCRQCPLRGTASCVKRR